MIISAMPKKKLMAEYVKVEPALRAETTEAAGEGERLMD